MKSTQTRFPSSVKGLLNLISQITRDLSKFLERFQYVFSNSLFLRYLAPGDLTAYQFGFIIRKRIKLPEKDSLYFFVNGRYILKGDTLMSEVYQQRKDPDGFLYITYTDESALG